MIGKKLGRVTSLGKAKTLVDLLARRDAIERELSECFRLHEGSLRITEERRRLAFF